MYLDHPTALKLWVQIQETILHQNYRNKITNSIVVYEEALKKFRSNLEKTEQSNLKNTDPYHLKYDDIKELRKLILNRESEVLNFNGQDIRVFYPKDNSNVLYDIETIFARGLDTLIGAYEIVENYNKQMPSTHIEARLQLYTSCFCNRIAQIKNTTPLTKASIIQCEREFAYFSGVLVTLLHDNDIVNSRSAAKKAISLARDVMWKKSFGSQSHCTVLPNILRYDQSLQLPDGSEKNHFQNEIWKKKFVKKESSNEWDNFENQVWYQELLESLGSWVKPFIQSHQDLLRHTPTTSMTRSLPQLPNAYDVSVAYIKSENNTPQVEQILHTTTAGISEPFQIKNAEERRKWAFRNQANLIKEEQVIASYLERWDSYLNTNETLIIPILYQTLVTFQTPSPDFFKSSDCLYLKMEAVNWLREEYRNRIFYYDRVAKQIVPEENINTIKVTFDLLQTNNCINLHSARSQVSNYDVNHARQLIIKATSLLTLLDKDISTEDKEHLDKIIEFLRMSDYSHFNPVLLPNEETTKVIKELSIKFMSSNAIALKNFGLLIQTAVHLKSAVHETWIGAFHRRVANLPLLGLNRLLAGIMSTCAIPFKFCFPWWWRHQLKNKRIRIAATELLLANLCGGTTLGCMSALDRMGSVLWLAETMFMAYHQSGDINMPLQEYTTQDIKNHTEMATGVPSNKVSEQRGLVFHDDEAISSQHETAEEALVNKSFLRKGKFPYVSSRDYLSNAYNADNYYVKKATNKLNALIKSLRKWHSRPKKNEPTANLNEPITANLNEPLSPPYNINACFNLTKEASDLSRDISEVSSTNASLMVEADETASLMDSYSTQSKTGNYSYVVPK